jgi:CRP-like cAMP-binding protein
VWPLTLEETRRVAPDGYVRVALPGEPVIRQWESDRDVYVVLDGHAEVLRDGRRRAVLGPRDFFGELAALEWDAGYAAPRSATVVARTPLRLLVLRAPRFNELVRRLPPIERAVARAVRERQVA